MNKYKILVISIILIPLFAGGIFASDYTEKATVIKSDKDNHDLIVKRQDGTVWLIQHNRLCTSMNTEFPIDLIVSENEITYMKVDFNEQCKVYNSSPYTGEGKFVKLINSPNLLVPDHEAQVIWDNKKYSIEYTGDSCKNLRDFIDKRIYFYIEKEGDINGTIIIPGNEGECDFTFNNAIESVSPGTSTLGKIKNLDYQGQDSQVYFYWEPPDTTGVYAYIISYSRHPLDLKYYTSWKEMPNAKLVKEAPYTVKLLANEQKYYFYIATWQNDIVGDWTTAEATPVTPKPLSDGYYKAMQNVTDIPDSNTVLQKSQTAEAKTVEAATTEPAKQLVKYFVNFYSKGGYMFFKSFKLMK